MSDLGSIQWNNAKFKCNETSWKNSEKSDSSLGRTGLRQSCEKTKSRIVHHQLPREVTITQLLRNAVDYVIFKEAVYG